MALKIEVDTQPEVEPECLSMRYLVGVNMDEELRKYKSAYHKQ